MCGDYAKMPDLLLRDVPQETIDALERQAALHGRSAEAEHRLIVEQAIRAGFWERAAALRAETHDRICTSSAEPIRRDRDER
jgi:plasmid stability protein